MDEKCLFCKIVTRDVHSDIVYEDDDAIAFPDINPQAPVHLLVISKLHLRDVVELGFDPKAASGLISAIGATAAKVGITDFRTVFNTGAEVGQSVFHVHAHLLSGRGMHWPPG
jgi:histidine triad (HIT) family protein